MRYPFVFALVLCELTAGIASPQSIPTDLVSYLSLTSTQVQSINSLNTAFNRYMDKQQNQFYDLQSQAAAELAQATPDPNVVGNLYGQMIAIGRDYTTQLATLQSNVAAVLTPAQVTLVSALLAVARLQPLVEEAQSVDMEPQQPTGEISTIYDPAASVYFATLSCCSSGTIPIALVNYLNLSDAQNFAIQSAIQANQTYLNGQSLKLQELQNDIQTLAAAQTIDTASLGADYVSIAQIQNDEATQAGQLVTTVRNIITDQQQPQLAALDNALAQSGIESDAIESNILVLPPDLVQTYNPFSMTGTLELTGTFSALY